MPHPHRIEDITTASPLELINSQIASLEIRQRHIQAEISVLKQIIQNFERDQSVSSHSTCHNSE